MIWHDKKILFVHIPKVAGQSIESAFLTKAGLTWEQRASFTLMPNGEKEKGPPRLAHLTAQEYVSLGYLTEKEFRDYYKFTFVRNPWSRLYSEYNYRRNLGIKRYQTSFRNFVLKRFPRVEDDNYVKYQDLYRHVLPQVRFIYNDKGERLVDYIGRFESLNDDWTSLCEHIIMDDLTLEHKNETVEKLYLKRIFNIFSAQKKHYTEVYDDETRYFVEQYYRDDIITFNYKFGE